MVAYNLTKVIAIVGALLTIYTEVAEVFAIIDALLLAAALALVLSSIRTSPEKIYHETRHRESLSLGRIIMVALLGWLGLKVGDEILKKV